MNKLSKYLNNGFNTKAGKIAGLILPERIAIYLNDLENESKIISESNSSIILDFYNGNQHCVHQIKSICEKSYLHNDFKLYVFGSIASNDTINYSDFDGILIYNENKIIHHKEILELRKLIKKINLYTHLQDSLQHHGLLVIGQNELMDKNDELIFNLIKESKVVFGDNKQILPLENKNCYTGSFIKLKKSILAKLNNDISWKNQYFFKNMLSELLLFPCSYLQYKNQKYISKKDSFEIIKTIFSKEDLEVVHQLEELRTNWKQESINEKSLSETTVSIFKKTNKTSKSDLDKMKAVKPKLIEMLNNKR